MPHAPSRRSLLLAALLLAALAAAAWGGRQVWAWHHFRAGRTALDAGDFDDARHHLDACLRVWGDSADAHLLAARAARRSDDLDAAERHLHEYERSGGDAEPRTLEWAMLQAQRGRVGDAEEYLRGVVGRDDSPEAPLALEALAKGYVHTARMGEALVCLDELVRLRPADFAGRMLRGEVFGLLGEKDEALSDFEAAVAAGPTSFPARLRRADALARVGRLADAVADYEALRRARPDDPEVLLGLARLRHDCGQLDEADALLERLLAARPHHAGALAWRARVALRRGDGARAEGWARRAAEEEPDAREPATVLALALEAQGKADEARACRARIARIDDGLERLRRTIGGAGPAANPAPTGS